MINCFGECEQQELKDRIAVFRSEYDRLHKMFVERGNEMTALEQLVMERHSNKENNDEH